MVVVTFSPPMAVAITVWSCSIVNPYRASWSRRGTMSRKLPPATRSA